MKTKMILCTVIALCLMIGGVGCEEEQMWEILPDGKQDVIEQRKNGIVFKFCLLNEQGEPATVFKEGENFTFCFSLNNKTKDNISISTDFINNDFYRVYRNDNTDMGTPWTGIWCDFSIKPTEMNIASLTTMQLNCPWVLTSYARPDYPFCASESKDVLPKGNYYTTIHTRFKYVINKKQFNEKMHFRINFKIQ